MKSKRECLDVELQALFELQRYDECKAILKVSDEKVKEKWGGRILEAVRDYQNQERELYKKMVIAPESK